MDVKDGIFIDIPDARNVRRLDPEETWSPVPSRSSPCTKLVPFFFLSGYYLDRFSRHVVVFSSSSSSPSPCFFLSPIRLDNVGHLKTRSS